ncbi:ABC transporter permease subunit [Halobacillus litoralis]|uniref:ABC transporter permease subunit n=1 Tax=Halobacillus litoralis TaxID=45668 RepID=A0A845F9K4_9BACI|nr:ABC transporter permease [Halobacillus litoralis]MYL70327.1 ABC transporter permease subunit [Halobacillus litoralis]
MNTFHVMKRILIQFKRDKRSVALMVVAPLLVLSLMWMVLDHDDSKLELGAVDVPETMLEQLSSDTLDIETLSSSKAEGKLEEGTLDAVLYFENKEMSLLLEGSNPNAAGAIQKELQSLREDQQNMVDVEYYHGSEDLGLFDYVGPVLIGFFVFFFVFIVGGVSFLRERTQGTLERLLATPIRRSEIVFGYLAGFGLFTIVQSLIIALFSIYILEVFMDGNFLYVLIVTILLALAALSLGTLVSAFAKNEFQMIQFIPIIIVPQVFFSGLFPTEGLGTWVQIIGDIMPLTHGAEAMRGIMLRDASFADIQWEIYILLGFTALFTTLNIFALKKHRRL